MSAGLRSGELAAAAGVNAQTLRYYERRGLLAEPDRSLGGHRLYPEQAVTVLRVIKAAQRLGFTLDEVAELVNATRHRRAETGLQARAAAKLAEIDSRLAELTAVRDTLRAALAAGCDDLVTCSESPCCPVPFDSSGGQLARTLPLAGGCRSGSGQRCAQCAAPLRS
ncbi:MerR family transcriptional regulator [Nocardia takedensis]|uniref:MerR family transcriptional regulator n=1 Tax=Nocardia takedensis TaxID=259390 RepID=UPI0003198A1B|nr:MerR family transcriptional regulator [Nocardia takedensis]